MKRLFFAFCLAEMAGGWGVQAETPAAAPSDPVEALRALVPGRAATVTVPAGTYRLPAGGLVLAGLRDVTIEAAGATFLATDLKASSLQFSDCRNVTVRGLTLDSDPLPFTQGVVTAVDAAGVTVDFRVDAGYPALEKPYQVNHVHLFDPQGRWKDGAPDYYPRRVERTGPDTGRLEFSPSAPGLARIAPGDRLVLNIRKPSTVSIRDGCAGMVFEDVTLYSGGLGFLIRGDEDAGTYRRIRIARGPRPAGATSERLFSTSADGFNAAYTRRGPTLEDCDFAFMGDDGVNLHGVTLPVLRWIDGRTFLSMRPQRGERFEQTIRFGDEIRFLKDADRHIAATAQIAAIEPAEEDPAAWNVAARRIWPAFRDSKTASFYRIRLAQPVSGVAVDDLADVPATSAPRFSIRRCFFHDHRGRGLRLQSSDGTVEGNRFARIKGAAISIGPEYRYWMEAGWTRGIAVRGNTITDVGQGLNVALPSSYTLGAVSIFGASEPAGAATRIAHDNVDIAIEGNTIDGCSVDGIQVAGARGVKVTGNTIRHVDRAAPPEAGSDFGLGGPGARRPISVTQAEAEVTGNQTDQP